MRLLPDNYRHRIKNVIIRVKSSKFIVDEHNTSLINGKHLKYIGSISPEEMEKLIEFNSDKKFYELNSLDKTISYCAGDYVIDGTGSVFRVFGWDKSNGGADLYWDFLDGNGVIDIRNYV